MQKKTVSSPAPSGDVARLPPKEESLLIEAPEDHRIPGVISAPTEFAGAPIWPALYHLTIHLDIDVLLEAVVVGNGHEVWQCFIGVLEFETKLCQLLLLQHTNENFTCRALSNFHLGLSHGLETFCCSPAPVCLTMTKAGRAVTAQIHPEARALNCSQPFS